MTKDFNSSELLLDKIRGGGQAEFYNRYTKLSDDAYVKIPFEYKDLENAFQHAYKSAKIAYEDNENKARRFGYLKEILTEKKEIKNFGSRYYAYLDTNRDLWNNDMGIKYALDGKSKGKTFEEVADEIFNNIIKANSDFIVDYKKDKRRWGESLNENNIWNKIQEKIIKENVSSKFNNSFIIKNILKKQILDKIINEMNNDNETEPYFFYLRNNKIEKVPFKTFYEGFVSYFSKDFKEAYNNRSSRWKYYEGENV